MYIYLFDHKGSLTGPVEMQPIPGLGVQLPSNAVGLDDELAAPDHGYAWALVAGNPVQLVDHRGLIYHTDTGKSVEWESLGDLPEGYTVKPWPGAFYIWEAGVWQLDQAAQTAAVAAKVLLDRDEKMREATLRIAPLQDARDLSVATVVEEAALLSWKQYRIDLSRIEQQPGYPLTIDWPLSPGSAN